jgi:S1-C subfamily serine protease
MSTVAPEGGAPTAPGPTSTEDTQTNPPGPAWTWPVSPPPASSEGALAPRSLRRRRHHRAAGAAVILVAALAGMGVGHVVFGASSADTAGTTSATLSVPQVQAKVDPALVDVVSTIDYGEGEAAGTGIVLTSSGEVLTNNHVVEGATSIKVTDIGNGKTYSASVVGYDASADVAVIKLQGASGLETATLGNSTTVAVGEGVIAIGNAGGTGGTPSAATGTVTALGQSITASDEVTGSDEQLAGMVETDADVQPGDSGGPLVNMSGQVLAIDTAGSSTFRFQDAGSDNASGTDGFAIPINDALSVAKQIGSGKSSSSVHIGASAFLGVEVASTSAYSEFGTTTSGAAIVGVISGSPAAVSGLAAGDTVTSVGGHTVSSSSSLEEVMDRFHPGQKVTVNWVDQYGNPNKGTVALATGPTG